MRNFGGRPKRKPKRGERVHVGFRVPPDLKRRLEAAAKTSTRSISQEAELRLEQSFRSQDFLGGVEVQQLLDKVALAFAHEGQLAADSKRKRGEWAGDPECYQAAMLGAMETLLLQQPEPKVGTLPESIQAQIESLRGRMATHIHRWGDK
jgi:predicted transcriptional regulator